MAHGPMDRHVWLYSLIYPLFPLLRKYAYISNDHWHHPCLATISFFEALNPLIRKYMPDDNQQKFKIIMQIVEMAAKLSVEESGKSIETEEKVTFHPLRSVFAGLFNQNNRLNHFSEKPLSLSNLMPTGKAATGKETEDIQENVSMFLKELRKIDQESQLVFLLEKYFWSISSSKIPDISLYDEMKTTAAIATCLYAQYERGMFELPNPPTQTEQFLLISGDVSGIQRFIFNIPSKGAAKSLKGRSVYISLLSDVIVRYMLDQLGLFETNLLYKGFRRQNADFPR